MAVRGVLGARLGRDGGGVQRGGAGGGQDGDHRVRRLVASRDVLAGGTFGAPGGDRLLLRGRVRDVHVGFAADELGELEAERRRGADVGERAEHAGQVGEVLVLAEPGDDFQLAVGAVLDGLDRGEEVGGHRVEVVEAGLGEGVGGDEAGGDPHLGGRVGDRGGRGHDDGAGAVAGADVVGAGQDRLGSLRPGGQRQALALRVEPDVLGQVGFVDDEHPDPHPVEVGDRRVLDRLLQLGEPGPFALQLACPPFRRRPGQGVVRVERLEVGQAPLEHLAFDVGGQRDRLEMVVGADRGVEVAGGHPGGELAHRVALRGAVRSQDTRRGIEPQVVAGELFDHVAGHGEQGGAVDPAGAAGLLGGDDHRGGLAGTDAVGHQHTAVGGGEDAPHDVLSGAVVG